MANYSKKLLHYFYNKLDRYPILKNAYQMNKNSINKRKTEISNNIANSELLKPLSEQFIHWWQLYQRLVGLDTVEQAREKVILLQNKLSKSREVRHTLCQEAFIINNKAKELHGKLLMTKRDDPNYVTLTILDNENHKELSRNTEKLSLLDKEEKDYFMQLTTAFNEYQDAHLLNAQKYKYMSIVVSIIVTFLSLITAAIYHNQRLNEINTGLLELQELSETNIKNYFEQYLGKTSSKTSEGSGWLTYTKNSAYTVGKYLVLKGIVW